VRSSLAADAAQHLEEGRNARQFEGYIHFYTCICLHIRISLAQQLQQLRRTQQGDSTRSSCRTRSGRNSLRPHTLVLIYCGSLLQAYLRTCSHLRVGQAAPQASGTWRTRKASPPCLSDSVSRR